MNKDCDAKLVCKAQEEEKIGSWLLDVCKPYQEAKVIISILQYSSEGGTGSRSRQNIEYRGRDRITHESLETFNSGIRYFDQRYMQQQKDVLAASLCYEWQISRIRILAFIPPRESRRPQGCVTNFIKRVTNWYTHKRIFYRNSIFPETLIYRVPLAFDGALSAREV